MSERKMATIRQVSAIMPIPDADKICAYQIDGWTVVDLVGAYKIWDSVIYCEIDSWIPNSIAPFLSKGKEPREYNGVKGERLRTVKLRKQISQGLILPLSLLPRQFYELGEDVSEVLGIVKYEPPLPACLRGMVKGNFPFFIPKTDEERIQNLKGDLSEWIDTAMRWEASEKLDGSSMTVYYKDEDFGVCSRNLDLKETEGNSFWSIARSKELIDKLVSYGKNIAIQGELIGEGIQGNPYKIKGLDFYLFNIFDIDKQEYLNPIDRRALADELSIQHVPVLGKDMPTMESVSEYLDFAEGKSVLNASTEREGIVFKSVDGKVSFKAISNKFLLKDKGNL